MELPTPDYLDMIHRMALSSVKAQRGGQLDINLTPSQHDLTTTLRQFREHLGLTRRQFATQLGVSELIVRYWEGFNNHYPSRRNFEKILTLYRENYPKEIESNV